MTDAQLDTLAQMQKIDNAVRVVWNDGKDIFFRTAFDTWRLFENGQCRTVCKALDTDVPLF